VGSPQILPLPKGGGGLRRKNLLLLGNLIEKAYDGRYQTIIHKKVSPMWLRAYHI